MSYFFLFLLLKTHTHTHACITTMPGLCFCVKEIETIVIHTAVELIKLQ